LWLRPLSMPRSYVRPRPHRMRVCPRASAGAPPSPARLLLEGGSSALTFPARPTLPPSRLGAAGGAAPVDGSVVVISRRTAAQVRLFDVAARAGLGRADPAAAGGTDGAGGGDEDVFLPDMCSQSVYRTGVLDPAARLGALGQSPLPPLQAASLSPPVAHADPRRSSARTLLVPDDDGDGAGGGDEDAAVGVDELVDAGGDQDAADALDAALADPATPAFLAPTLATIDASAAAALTSAFGDWRATVANFIAAPRAVLAAAAAAADAEAADGECVVDGVRLALAPSGVSSVAGAVQLPAVMLDGQPHASVPAHVAARAPGLVSAACRLQAVAWMARVQHALLAARPPVEPGMPSAPGVALAPAPATAPPTAPAPAPAVAGTSASDDVEVDDELLLQLLDSVDAASGGRGGVVEDVAMAELPASAGAAVVLLSLTPPPQPLAAAARSGSDTTPLPSVPPHPQQRTPAYADMGSPELAARMREWGMAPRDRAYNAAELAETWRFLVRGEAGSSGGGGGGGGGGGSDGGQSDDELATVPREPEAPQLLPLPPPHVAASPPTPPRPLMLPLDADRLDDDGGFDAHLAAHSPASAPALTSPLGRHDAADADADLAWWGQQDFSDGEDVAGTLQRLRTGGGALLAAGSDENDIPATAPPALRGGTTAAAKRRMSQVLGKPVAGGGGGGGAGHSKPAAPRGRATKRGKAVASDAATGSSDGGGGGGEAAPPLGHRAAVVRWFMAHPEHHEAALVLETFDLGRTHAAMAADGVRVPKPLLRELLGDMGVSVASAWKQ
jgi:uncharacterized membrane protein YgcG